MNETKLEVIEPSAVESIQRAEIDVQIATAKRYPRQLWQVKSSMMSFATLDRETAEACFYSLPRGGKNIQGASVRLAEIAVSCYGNLRAGSRIISTVTTGDNPHVVIQAVAHDLERNVAVTMEKRRRITKKRSKDAIDEDDINLAANAGSAIAFRDAVFKVVPMALIKPVLEAAKKVAIGDAKTLADRRAKMVDAFAKMGVQKDRIITTLEKKSIEDIDLSDLETLMGLFNAIKEGQTTIEDAFPPPPPSKPIFTPQVAKPIDQGEGTDLGPQPKKSETKPDELNLNVPYIIKIAKGYKITEAELIEFMRSEYQLDESLSELAEIAMVAQPSLKKLWDNWGDVVKEIQKRKEQPKAA